MTEYQRLTLHTAGKHNKHLDLQWLLLIESTRRLWWISAARIGIQQAAYTTVSCTENKESVSSCSQIIYQMLPLLIYKIPAHSSADLSQLHFKCAVFCFVFCPGLRINCCMPISGPRLVHTRAFRVTASTQWRPRYVTSVRDKKYKI